MVKSLQIYFDAIRLNINYNHDFEHFTLKDILSASFVILQTEQTKLHGYECYGQ